MAAFILFGSAPNCRERDEKVRPIKKWKKRKEKNGE